MAQNRDRQLIKFETDGVDVLIAIEAAAGAVRPASKLDDAVKKISSSLDAAFGIVSKIGKSFRSQIVDSGAESGTLEMGLQFTGKGTIYVVETEAQATFKVTLEYKNNG